MFHLRRPARLALFIFTAAPLRVPAAITAAMNQVFARLLLFQR
jgi:hypothetical protein